MAAEMLHATSHPVPPANTGLFMQVLLGMWHQTGALQQILDAGHDINELDARGEALLHVACADTESFAGRSDTLVKQLLQAGADPNVATSPHGFTPLMMTDSAEVAACLLNNGADWGQLDVQGWLASGGCCLLCELW
jgi:ankyrin repeat protein